MKKARYLSLLLALSLTLSLSVPALPPARAAQPAEELTATPMAEATEGADDGLEAIFPDSALLAAVRSALDGKALSTLKTLDLTGVNVATLTGLDQLRSLSTLIIDPGVPSTALDDTDMEVLSQLPLLSDLTIHNTSITKVPRLPQSTLYGLDLSQNKISDVEDIASLSLPSWSPIYLSGNALGEAGLSRLLTLLPQTVHLYVADNGITSIDCLSSFGNASQLKTLDLSGNPITDFSPISHCVTLTTLKLDRCVHAADALSIIGALVSPEVAVDALSKNPIRTLSLAGCELTSLSWEDEGGNTVAPLASLTSLSSLNVSNNHLTSLAGAPKPTTQLLATNNALTALPELSNNVQLVRLSYNQLTGLSGLPANVGTLYVDHNQISDLSGIQDHQLRNLYLSNNKLTDLTPLATQTDLIRLDVSYNDLISLAGIPTCTSFTTLSAVHNQIAKLTVLPSTLITLDLRENQLTSISFLEPMSALRTVKLDENYLSTVADSAAAQQISALQSREPAVNITWADQKVKSDSDPEDSIAVSVPLGEGVTTTILVSSNSVTRGSCFSVRARCENQGAQLEDLIFQLHIPAQDLILTNADGTPLSADSLVFHGTLGAKGTDTDHVEFLFSAKVASSFQADGAISLFTSVARGGSSYTSSEELVSVYYATISAPQSVYPNRAFNVYGEATVGSQVSIYGIYQDPTDPVLLTGPIQMASNNRWYTATIPADRVTADLVEVFAQVTCNDGASHSSAHAAISVNSWEVYFDHSKIVGPDSWEYGPTNSRVGFPTLIATLNSKMIGPDLRAKVWFGNPESATSVKFLFAGQELTGTYDNASGCYISPVFHNWSATGVQAMTAVVTYPAHDDPDTQCMVSFTVAQFTILIDPSGIVTDEDGTPLEGVEVTLYRQPRDGEVPTDATSGDWIGTTWVKWEAEDYLQQDPVYTDAAGHYGWDVPEGTYCLTFSKEGYVFHHMEQYIPAGKTELEAITIPPIRTDVDVVMLLSSLGNAVREARITLEQHVWHNEITADKVLEMVQGVVETNYTVTWAVDFSIRQATTSAPGSVSGTLRVAVANSSDPQDYMDLPFTGEIAQLPGGSSEGSSGGSSGSSTGTTTRPKPTPTPTPTPTPEPQETPEPEETPSPEPPVERAPLVFSDLSEEHWAKADIDYMTSHGLLVGIGGGRFGPEVDMSRGMMVTLLGRMAKADAQAGDEFTDVPADRYYAPYVSWAYQSQIVVGVSPGIFAPDRPITRQEMCVMLANYIGLREVDDDLSLFTDLEEIEPWARPAVAMLHHMGLIYGMSADTFSPQSPATRAQCAAILHRLLDWQAAQETAPQAQSGTPS